MLAGARQKAAAAAGSAVDRARAASAEAKGVLRAGVAEAKTTAKEKLNGAVQSGKDMAVSLLKLAEKALRGKVEPMLCHALGSDPDMPRVVNKAVHASVHELVTEL